MVDATKAEKQLILHEGLRLKAYLDTEGFWTVGVGYNVSARGTDQLGKICGRVFAGGIENLTLSRDEALKVLRYDIHNFEEAIRRYFPTYDVLNEVRQRVCLDMAFNLGWKAAGFHQTIAYIKENDWSGAAKQLYLSKWSRQVGDGPGGKWDRCDRLAKMLLTGLDYTI